VKEAAAIAIPDDVVGSRIRAVVSFHDGQSAKTVELQTYCSAKIPAYMIPEAIEFREELPKTSTGKVDRVRLVQESQQASEPVTA